MPRAERRQDWPNADVLSQPDNSVRFLLWLERDRSPDDTSHFAQEIYDNISHAALKFPSEGPILSPLPPSARIPARLFGQWGAFVNARDRLAHYELDTELPSLSGSPQLMSRFAIRRCSTSERDLWKGWQKSCLLALSLCWFCGCRSVAPTPIGLPRQSSLENEHLSVRSDVKLPSDHPVLRDLDALRDQIADELNLPVQKQPVTVYLFSDEVRYAQYLQARYPLLPPRRAYFVGTPKELAVYTFWGERIQEDLRHEYTHGVLHASLVDVPLWLDEGLAEYFEVTSQPTGLNRDYAMRLANNLSQGWKPDLNRLEAMEKVEDMQKADYLEAWAWVHFMLHHSEETRGVLVDYLHELRTNGKPGLLSKRLKQTIPTADQRFVAHASSLTSGVQQASGTLDFSQTARP